MSAAEVVQQPDLSALTEEAWQDRGREFADRANATAWEIGDWLVTAEEFLDGEQNNPIRYQRATKLSGLAYGTLRNRASVASCVVKADQDVECPRGEEVSRPR
jgi:hypothetical protein